jgi:hypothetical protein
MRVRNHALDGLRGLAALGVLTLHVWMFTVQGARPRRGREPPHRRAAPGRGALLRALGLPARGPVGRERPRRAPGAPPGSLRGEACGARRARLLGRDARLVLAASGERAPLRDQRRAAAAVRGLRPELRGLGRRPARPADVVAGRRGQLLRCAPARGVAARALRAAGPHGRGLCGTGRSRRRVERGGRAARVAGDGDVDAADLPARLRLRDGGRSAGPSPRPVARAVVGAWSSPAAPWWAPTPSGITRGPP